MFTLNSIEVYRVLSCFLREEESHSRRRQLPHWNAGVVGRNLSRHIAFVTFHSLCSRCIRLEYLRSSSSMLILVCAGPIPVLPVYRAASWHACSRRSAIHLLLRRTRASDLPLELEMHFGVVFM